MSPLFASGTLASPGEKRSVLRRLLSGTESVVLAGAHDGLTARLCEEAAFDAVWASGFEISASHALPDASILTMTELLAAATMINRATQLPVVADCDTGFGNAINAMRSVQEYESAGISGICIEDSLFPKRCSFYDDVNRALEPTQEFVRKIRAVIRARSCSNFVVIARTEALITGGSIDDALLRARAYADEGADAVLVHSKLSTVDELVRFAAAWDRKVPLACVPTIYAEASVRELHTLGFRVVIFANQAIRSAVKAVAATLRCIRQTGVAASVDDSMVTLAEMYRLVQVDALRQAERSFVLGDRADG